MHNLVSLILIFISAVATEVSQAQAIPPKDASQCTRGNNPLQDAKDTLGIAQSELLDAAKQIDENRIDAAQKLVAKASNHLEGARKKTEANDRSLPESLLSDFKSFTTDIQAAKKTANSLKTRVTTLIKSLDDFAGTMGCPRTREPVKVALLPPDPLSKEIGKKSANYRIYALGLNGQAQLVREWHDIPFGDCADCTRGISLNCRDHGKDLASAPIKKAACASGLDNGIGIRLVLRDGKWDADVKNGSKYTVTQQFNALAKVLPPATEPNFVQLFILKQGAVAAPDNLIYQVVMSAH